MRKCFICTRPIKDTESCWRDHSGKYICDDCDNKMKGKHDGIKEQS